MTRTTEAFDLSGIVSGGNVVKFTTTFDEALDAGVRELDGEMDGDQDVIYPDSATGDDYRSSADAVAVLGAAVLAGVEDAYSGWCSVYSGEVVG